MQNPCTFGEIYSFFSCWKLSFYVGTRLPKESHTNKTITWFKKNQSQYTITSQKLKKSQAKELNASKGLLDNSKKRFIWL